jgi:acyl-CoA synthetase (AMP-forming)/AMP-acid ligase II
VRRAEEFGLLGRVLDDASAAGVVVGGPTGVGKTRLVAEALRDRDEATHQVIHLTYENGLSGDSPTGDRRLIVCVDDGHLFDDESAAEVVRRVRSGRAFLLTVRCCSRSVPRSLSKLWTDELARGLVLERIEIAQGLPTNTTGKFLKRVLQDRLATRLPAQPAELYDL